MKNRLFSILIALFITLPFMTCSLPPGSLKDPMHDPQQEHLPEGMKGHIKKNRIQMIAYSPDGTRIAVVSSNGIWLYNAHTGNELVQFAGHKDYVWNVAFSPDGRTIVSTGQRTIRIWDVNAARNLRTFRYQVWDVAFSPDGKTIISGGWDKNLYLLDVDTGKRLRTLSGHTNKVWSVAFSPDGKTIASASDDLTIRLWDANTGQLLRKLKGNTDTIRNVVFSPDGKTIASGGKDLTICLWDANTGQLLRKLKGNWGGVRRVRQHLEWPPPPRMVAFNPDGKTIASASVSEVHLWDVKTGEHLRKLISGF